MTGTPLTPADLRMLVTAGGAAPSLHNSQPWRFTPTLDGFGLAVHADFERTVPLADPSGAALYIAVGAAVFNLRVAAWRLGREAVVRLLPDVGAPTLLAVLDLSRSAGPRPPFGCDLYPAVAARHSSRQPFVQRDVPETVLGELIAAAREEGVTLAALEEAAVRRVLALTAEAEGRNAEDPARQAESRAWLRAGPAEDGIPYAALGPQDHEARVPVREFAGRPPYPGQAPPAQPSRRFEPLPQLCTFTTAGDEPADWLRTGQALEHVWLLATVHGIRLTVWHQAVEWSDTRWALRDPAEGPGHVQLVIRVGYGPPGAATSRRPVESTLDAPWGLGRDAGLPPDALPGLSRGGASPVAAPRP
ncbi:hypothetical protein [Kitasatospora sp. NPDC097643]|uniref:Acg family FMN-binding oxidoreductase n=1 Tax=Kitasatospora sp. NPDC097643 TaxID=3157230 RepID=UPI0033246DB7